MKLNPNDFKQWYIVSLTQCQGIWVVARRGTANILHNILKNKNIKGPFFTYMGAYWEACAENRKLKLTTPKK
jgi:hypothetical protein